MVETTGVPTEETLDQPPPPSGVTPSAAPVPTEEHLVAVGATNDTVSTLARIYDTAWGEPGKRQSLLRTAGARK